MNIAHVSVISLSESNRIPVPVMIEWIWWARCKIHTSAFRQTCRACFWYVFSRTGNLPIWQIHKDATVDGVGENWLIFCSCPKNGDIICGTKENRRFHERRRNYLSYGGHSIYYYHCVEPSVELSSEESVFPFDIDFNHFVEDWFGGCWGK